MQKVKFPVDADMIHALRKEKKLTYKDIENISGGLISEMSLKHFLNKGLKVDEDIIDNLANIFECSKNSLIDKKYLLSTNLSFEINKIIGNLYYQNHEDINSNYAQIIKKFREKNDLRIMLNVSHRLFITLSSEDYILDKSVFVKTFNIIKNNYLYNYFISNRNITYILDKEADNLYSKIISASGDYNTQQVILMFLFVFILFDAIFLMEAVASTCQLVPERKTNKADQYFSLTYRCEKMRNTLIDFILYKEGKFDNPNIIDFGIDDKVIESIILMLSSCEKCYQHINGVYVDSEYINRASLSAILSHLEKIFVTIDIKLPEENFLIESYKMNTSRFGIQYNILKIAFNKLNPPRKTNNKNVQNYKQGFLDCLLFSKYIK
jgi:transcriptional regulator with XRE-family HTH domain